MNSINLREEDYIMREVKIISMATTALLAVAPVITSPVLAAENTLISTTSQKLNLP